MFLTNVLNPISEQTPDLPSIKIDSVPFDIAIPKYATSDKLSFFVGCVDGTIRSYTARPTEEWWKPEQYDEEGIDLYEEEDEDDEEEDSVDDEVAVDAFAQNFSLKQSSTSIRGIKLLPNDHSKLVSITRDGSFGLVDTEHGKLIIDASKINACGFEAFDIYDNNFIVVGDEEGSGLGYDLRIPVTDQQKPVFTTKKASKSNATTSTQTDSSNGFSKAWIESDHGDYITDVCLNLTKQHAMFASADGHLSQYDIRSGKFRDISERNPDELMSCCMLKDDDMVITGSNTGPLSIYDAHNIADYKERYLCQESSVDNLMTLDTDTILSGGEDGIVRIITIKPSHVIGVVAVHKEPISAFDVLRGSIDPEDYIWSNDVVGVASTDNVIRFWSVQDMQILRKTRKTKTGKIINYKKHNVDDDSDEDEDEQLVEFKKMLYEAEQEELKLFFAKHSKVKAGDADADAEVDHDADADGDDAETQIGTHDFSDDDDLDMDPNADDWDDSDSDSDDDLLDNSDDDDDDDDDMTEGFESILNADDDDDDNDDDDDDEDEESFSDLNFDLEQSSDEEGPEKTQSEKSDKSTVKKTTTTTDTSKKRPRSELDELSSDDFGDDSDDDDDDDEDSDSDGKKTSKSKPQQKQTGKKQQQQAKDKQQKKTKKPIKKQKKSIFIRSATDFDPEQFRKSHGHKLADAKSTGYYQERKAKQKAEHTGAKSALPALPDISRKLPRVRKVKHGTSNFFNGL